MEVSLESILKSFISFNINQINTCMVGEVVNTDNLSNGFVDVQPLVNKRGGNYDTYEYPVISYVPVVMPATTTAGIILPVKRGDTVLLVIGQHCFDQFKLGVKVPHDTLDLRRFDISDAVAFVGFNTTQDSVWNSDNHKKEYIEGSLKLYNNLGTDNECCVELAPDGIITAISPQKIIAEAPLVEAVDINIRGVGSVKQFMLTHTHGYFDDGNKAETLPPTEQG